MDELKMHFVGRSKRSSGPAKGPKHWSGGLFVFPLFSRSRLQPGYTNLK